MTISSVAIITKRIETATKRSPIAVFQRTPERFEALFADTTRSSVEMELDKDFIGTFHGFSGSEKFRRHVVNIKRIGL